MNTFEQIMQNLASMPKDERAKLIDAQKAHCICVECPSYTDCAKNSQEVFFCGIGQSFTCISQDKGCICPTCPVTANLGLKYKDYCLKGSEKSQRYDSTPRESKNI